MSFKHNNAIRQSILKDAEALGNAAGRKHGYPIPISIIAQQRGIAKVEFKPLFVDAVLLAGRGEFHLILACDQESRADLNEVYARGDGRKLPARLRFTLAHEIAHTFFYEFSPQGKIGRRLSTKHERETNTRPARTAREAEEVFCNAAAARLLVPTEEIKRQSLTSSPYQDPSELSRYCEYFNISPDSLLSRLDDADLKSYYSFYGTILFFRKDSTGHWRLSRRILGRGVVPSEVELIAMGQMWPDDLGASSFLLNGGRETSTVVTLPTATGSDSEFLLNAHNVGRKSAFLIVYPKS